MYVNGPVHARSNHETIFIVRTAAAGGAKSKPQDRIWLVFAEDCFLPALNVLWHRLRACSAHSCARTLQALPAYFNLFDNLIPAGVCRTHAHFRALPLHIYDVCTFSLWLSRSAGGPPAMPNVLNVYTIV
jgi:hypothetical protein